MDYKEAYTRFSTAYADMAKRFQEWVEFHDGRFDTEGYVVGLPKNLMIRYERLNDKMTAMLEYVVAVEAERKAQSAELHRLRTRCHLLEAAERAEKYTDAYVMQEVNFHKAWTIDAETSIDEFKLKLRDTIFFLELALKRGLIEYDEPTEKKIMYSKLFLQSEEDFKYFYFSKKSKLKEAAKTPALLHEHTKDISKPA